MKAIATWEFTHPDLLPLDENIKTAAQAILASDKSDPEKEDWANELNHAYSPWGITYEVQPYSGNTFRVFANDWHLDSYEDRFDTSIFSSSTPASFAACELTVLEGMKEVYEGKNIRSVLSELWRRYDRQWLEVAADESDRSPMKMELARLVTVTGLSIMQPPPYTVAKGPVASTLHIGSLREESAPSERIIGIALT